jgi:hypothetical protein
MESPPSWGAQQRRATVERIIAAIETKLAKAERQQLVPRLLATMAEELELMRLVQNTEMTWELPTEEQYDALEEQIEDLAAEEVAENGMRNIVAVQKALPKLSHRAADRARQFMRMQYVVAMWAKWVASDLKLPPGFSLPHDTFDTGLVMILHRELNTSRCAPMFAKAHSSWTRLYQFARVPCFVHGLMALYSGGGRGVVQNWRDLDGDHAIGLRIARYLARPKFPWKQKDIDKARLDCYVNRYVTAHVLPDGTPSCIVDLVKAMRGLPLPSSVSPFERVAFEVAYLQRLTSISAACLAAYGQWMWDHPHASGTNEQVNRDWVRLWNEP